MKLISGDFFFLIEISEEGSSYRASPDHIRRVGMYGVRYIGYNGDSEESYLKKI